MSQTSLSDGLRAGLVGSWLAMALFGVTTTQMYLYWIYYPKDRLWTKALVSLVWVLSALHAICVCQDVYYHLITTEPSFHNTWTLGALLIFHHLTFFAIMCYYTRTIFLLSSKRVRWWLTGFIVILLLFAFGFSLDVTIRVFMSSSLLDMLGFTISSILPGYALRLVTDVFVTGSLCGILYKAKHEFSPRSTQNILNRLIIYAAGRGLLTLVTDLTIVLTLVITPNQMWYSALEFMITGLYANSLMVMLNSRRPSSEIEDISLETLQRHGAFQVTFPSLSGGVRVTADVGNGTSNLEFRVVDIREERSNRANNSQTCGAKADV